MPPRAQQGGSRSPGVDEGDEDEEDEETPAAFSAQWKVHLFQAASVQKSIKRFWDVLPKTENGELSLEGYVDLNVRLQRALVPEFNLERAMESAIHDWYEDVAEGESSMKPEGFTMFLFELCTLWCNANVSLPVYLLFLNATFIAISESKGTISVGLKRLEDVQLLSGAFFDLLLLQRQSIGLTKTELETLSQEQAFGIWYLRNFGKEQETLLRVQRQVFTVTHDIRSVYLFRMEDGTAPREQDFLELVEKANLELENVFPTEPERLLDATVDGSIQPLDRKKPVKITDKKGNLPMPQAAIWWPPNYSSPPVRQAPETSKAAPKPQAPGSKAGSTAAKSSQQQKALMDQQKKEHSASGILSNLPSSGPPRAPSPPKLPKRAVPPGGRVVTKDGGKIGAVSSAGKVLASGGAAPSSSRSVLGLAGQQTAGVGGGAGAQLFGVDAGSSGRPYELNRVLLQTGTSIGSEGAAAGGGAGAGEELQAELDALGADEATIAQLLRQEAARYVQEPPYGQGYNLPPRPPELYKNMTDSLLTVKPNDITFSVKKLLAVRQLNRPDDFSRVLDALPEDLPRTEQGVVKMPGGPFRQAPNEPVWFEMNHRLHGLINKATARVERRRKRRLRSKLFKGRIPGKPASKRDEARDLRLYLDSKLAEYAKAETFERTDPGFGAGAEATGEGVTSEFVMKAQEDHQKFRERIQGGKTPFRVAGPTELTWAKGGPKARPVNARPVYMPPPDG